MMLSRNDMYLVVKIQNITLKISIFIMKQVFQTNDILCKLIG
ncbi:hypothetical protein BC643_1122 [Mangrovibacterium diazotrophicum]|uniref:Uncharacterized protein n=1 Tax=Mangrovibacterium diazotrophicum TaxID=1261403 RepID=A0A419W5P0_9BACT|nr:hypothetical protein BC643_1122 [Mangrovibacterium diazotrophicum]